MKDIGNIEDWYRDELNNYNVEPDKNLWDSLSGDLDASTPLTDETVSEWYKKEVSKLEERPDYSVWEKLSTQLDTTSVWDKLAVSLNRYDQLIWWRNMAIRGTAIFLLCFGSYLAYNNYSKNDNQIAENVNPATKEHNPTTTSPAIKEQKEPSTYEKSFLNTEEGQEKKGNAEDKNQQSKTLAAKHPKENSNSNETDTPVTPKEKIATAIEEVKLTSKADVEKYKGRSKDNNTYASLDKIQQHYSSIYKRKLDELKTEEERTIFKDINRHQLTEKDISHLLEEGEYLVKKDNNRIVFNSRRFSSYSMFGVYARRFYAGFNVGIKKQGMITSIKEDSPLADYKRNSLLDFGSSFGGTVGFILSDNVNLEANINLNSTSGYKRAFNDKDISYQENLNLNYTTINLLAKKMNNKSTFDNKVYSTNFIGGIYASYLRTAVSEINGASQKLNEYNKTDYGIVLGIEQDRYVTKTLVITPGIRYSQGISNTANADSQFEASRNFSFEFNLGVKYIFLKKGK